MKNEPYKYHTLIQYYLFDWRKICLEFGRSARGEIVDFDLMAIKQQIADAKNKVEVAVTQNFVDHRPVIIEQAVLPPVQKTIDEDESRDWDIPESVVATSEQSSDGALAAATDLVKPRKK